MTRVLPACLCALALSAAPARAATYEVTSLEDGGPGTLRAALEQALATSEPDTLALRAEGTIALDGPLPELHGALALTGPGAERLAITASGEHRVLQVAHAADVGISGVTLRGGRDAHGTDAAGGTIYNGGALALDGVTVTGGSVRSEFGRAAGGGIYNSGTLTVRRSVVRANTATAGGAATAQGGGLYNIGALTVIESTVEGNAVTGRDADAATSAAGIAQAASTAVIVRSTIAGNEGVGIHNGTAHLELDSSTVSGNRRAVTTLGGHTAIRSSTLTAGAAGSGANLTGITIDIDGFVTLENTLLADAGPGAPSCSIGGQVWVTSRGHNLADDGSCAALTALGDRQGADPGLAPLRDNGGPTRTHAIAPAGPAHDQGRAAGPDQRGADRPADDPAVGDAPGGDGADIGAFERSVTRTTPAEPPAPPVQMHAPDPAVRHARPAARRPRLHIDRVARRRDGAWLVRIGVPGAGRLRVSGPRVRDVARRVRRARDVTVAVRPDRAARRRLKRTGRLRARVGVRFAPVGGATPAAASVLLSACQSDGVQIGEKTAGGRGETRCT